MATVDKLVKARVVADMLSVSVKTVYKWTHEGFIPHYVISSRAIRFKVSEVQIWSESRRVNGRATRLKTVY